MRSVLLAVLAVAALVPAQPSEKKSDAPLNEARVVERVNAATDRALAYLEKKQAKDGSWNVSNNAINGLSVLAFLSRGHVPGRGKYGDTVGEGGAVRPGVLTLAKKYLIATQVKTGPTEGYMAAAGGSMYAHGLATLALVELYGQDPDPELEAAARKAVDCILRSQGAEGGWDYAPSPTGGSRDLSVSVMQIVAMRAARNAEIPVPEASIKKAIAYLKARANPGGPGYAYTGAGPGTCQTSAAGVLSMQLLGHPEDPQIAKTIDWLASTTKADWAGGGAQYFYYYHYYAIQAFYQHGGKQWNEWHPPIRELLLSKQNKDGSWDVPPGTSEAGYSPAENKAYSTALGCLVLNIYQHFLPAYQR